MTCVLAPAAALYTIETLPLELSGVVTLLARTSPSGKFSDDVEGLFVAVGVTARNPPAVWFATVRFPVTATALTGIGARPVIWTVRAVLAVNRPVRPFPLRESSNRTGATGT